ncbi:hypothetical protein [Nitrososphaera viennensis]|uniref:Uncharacterized protein n=2 Tax=Nitrososphaera viennensis TaxID=1034015 RepID=A0A060HG16_9ARCH|nr:hypothetical protein [Nitrososphaera viennensis]AIC14533.1 hypothetical protein NVIE_003420 [Nitrososphaera viennensis EN76]UVS69506.1 hypothetical protein NWT39_01655 [Nitrososphaera viennensis]
MSIADVFDVGEGDTVADAWLTTVNLLDMLEHAHGVEGLYDFSQARDKIAKVYAVAEAHSMDSKNNKCACGLSDAEHAILKRKVLTFFRLQVSNLKRFIV